MKRIAAVAAWVMLLPACASVTRGTKEVLQIKSEPPTANVALSDGVTCVTPCSLKMKRKYGVHVTVTKAGYQTVETTVNTEVATGGGIGFAGNALIGGVIGAGVDASNGSMNKFVPNPLDVALTPLADDEVAADPVVKPGESFYFKEYAKKGEKLPFEAKERKKLEKEKKLAEAKAAKEAEQAKRQAEKQARQAEKEARKAAREEAKAQKVSGSKVED